jgi:hypothetical protein
VPRLMLLTALLVSPVAAGWLGAAGAGDAAGGALGEGPAVVVAASLALSPALDSAQIHRGARRAQEDFERLRERQIPAERGQGGGRCDEPVGRLCLRFAPEGASPPPIAPVPRPIVEARRVLLDALAEAARELPGDDWIAGQRVRYLLEDGDLLGAGAVVDRCQGTPWWCLALDGWVFHEDGHWVDAAEAFLDALEAMPPEERSRWEGEDFILERDGRRFLDVSDAGERERRRALLWRLADPLYMVPGNDRWTGHMARLTLVRTLEDAWNPFGLPWEADLEEILLRYGWAMGWERTQGQLRMGQITPNNMVARLDPDRRRYLPTGPELEVFPATEDDALRVIAGRETTGYSPAYAPVVTNLTSQTARFRRGDSILVVHAFSRVPDEVEEPLPRDFRSALFLLPVDGPVVEDGPRPVREGMILEGVWTAQVSGDTDRILSMEGLSTFERRAWRTRRGLERLPDPVGTVAVSDPIFLSAESFDHPLTLDEALSEVLPTVRFEGRAQVRLAWEVYGIPQGEQLRVTLGLERAERSLVRRIGEFFRVIEPAEPITIRWDDAPLETPGVVFRTLDLGFPDLEPGRYDLFLEVTVPGSAEPAVTRRRFVVEGG